MKRKLTQMFNLPVAILCVLLLGSAMASVYFYKQVQVLKENPQEQAQEAADALVAEVGKLILLPDDEEPTIVTVNDPEKLKNQPFFANAKVGDKVLIYTNAKKAILYDPVAKKIIEVAPINLGASDESTSSEVSSTESSELEELVTENTESEESSSEE